MLDIGFSIGPCAVSYLHPAQHPATIHHHPWYRARSPEVLTLRCRALAAVRQAAGGSSKVGATEALDAAKLAKQAKLNARVPASHDGDVMR